MERLSYCSYLKSTLPIINHGRNFGPTIKGKLGWMAKCL